MQLYEVHGRDIVFEFKMVQCQPSGIYIYKNHSQTNTTTDLEEY